MTGNGLTLITLYSVESCVAGWVILYGREDIFTKLSLDSTPMKPNPTALRLLSLLCLLPDGADRVKLEEMNRISGFDSSIRAPKLVSLIYEEHSRLKVLSPIRGYVLKKSSTTCRSQGCHRISLVQYFDYWPTDSTS